MGMKPREEMRAGSLSQVLQLGNWDGRRLGSGRSFNRPAGPIPAFLEQVIEPNGFRDEIVHAGCKASIAIVREGARSQSNDGHFFYVTVQSTDPLGGLKSIQLRHV